MKKFLIILILLGLTGCANQEFGADITIEKIEIVKADLSDVKIEKLSDRKFIEESRATSSIISKNDFTKEYKSEEKTLLIQSIDKKSKLEIELLSSYNMMVGAGESVLVADLRLKDWSGKNNLFDVLDFYDVKNNYQKIEKQFIYKYASESTTTSCIELAELTTEYCYEEKKANWGTAIEFKTLDELPNKNIRIGIFTKTTLGENIEWLPTIENFDIYEWAEYDVTEINELEYDVLSGQYNSLVMINSTHFILAYAGDGNDGYIKTFSIDGSYDNITEIDSLEHDGANGQYNSLVMINSTHFILAYAGDGSDGYIKTFSIDGSYDNITEIDSLEHDSWESTYNSFVMIDSTHFMLTYQGGSAGYKGIIATFSIDGSYDNITQIDELIFDGNNNLHNSLVMIDSTHFINAWAGDGSDGYIATFSIDGSYDNITKIQAIEHETTLGSYNSLVKIDSTHFMLAYQGSDSDGFLTNFSINGSYEITEGNSIEHDGVVTYSNSLVMIDSTHFILAYRGGSILYGRIKVFSMDGSYNLTEESTLTHETGWCLNLSFLMIDSTHFILAYKGPDSDGFIKTFSMESGGEPPASDTCTYSGTGDWNVLYSDNCYCTSYTHVAGDFNLIYDGAGSFGLQCVLGADDVNVGAGATISAQNSTAQIDIY